MSTPMPSFKVVDSDSKDRSLTITTTDNQINDFMKTLSGTEVADIHEIKETLEDYFMSFYKENKTFGGI